jgi:hypothetical protein
LRLLGGAAIANEALLTRPSLVVNQARFQVQLLHGIPLA